MDGLALEAFNLVGTGINESEKTQLQTDQAIEGTEATIRQIDAARSKIEQFAETLMTAGVSAVEDANQALERAGEAHNQIRSAADILRQVKTTIHGAMETLRVAQTHIQATDSLTSLPTSTPARSQPTVARQTATVHAQPPYPRDRIKAPDQGALDHICKGSIKDGFHSGGHMYGQGRPSKTIFPRGWDEEEISWAVTYIAKSPDTERRGKDNKWVVHGRYRGVTVAVFVDSEGRVVAGYPKKGRGVIGRYKFDEEARPGWT